MATGLLVLCVLGAQCDAEDLSRLSTDAVIDALAALNRPAPGLSGDATYDAFIAESKSPEFLAGRLPAEDVAVPPAMREIARRGASALPALLAHLGDARETKLVVGSEGNPLMTFGGQFFADEYDPRDLAGDHKDCTLDDSCRSMDHPYAVRIDDVCEVLIGQIVNRRLNAVRYQPSNLLYVNSPVQTPSLAARLRADWSGLDAKGLEASLLSDLRREPELDEWHGYRDALIRLRFYYPAAYAALAGDDLKKRQAFEADEKARANQR